MQLGVHKTFPSVKQVLRLCLISPDTSCTAERILGALGALETWPLSTMPQAQLNYAAKNQCHHGFFFLSEERLSKSFAEEQTFLALKSNRFYARNWSDRNNGYFRLLGK